MPLGPIKRLSLSLATINFARILKKTQAEKIVWENGDNILCESAINLKCLNTICDPNSAERQNIHNMDQTDFDSLKAAVSKLVDQKIIHTTVDIQEITGLAASGSDIAKRRTMEEFLQKDCAGFYEPTEHNFQANYEHKQIRAIHEPNSENLMMFGWNTKLYLANAGGSHHFACLRHIASELDRSVPITSNMVLQALNRDAVSAFNQDYSFYLFNSSIHYSLISEFIESQNLPSYTCCINIPSSQIGLLFLQKDHWQLSQSSDSAIKDVLTDFGSELTKLASIQENNQQFQTYWSR